MYYINAYTQDVSIDKTFTFCMSLFIVNTTD